MATIGCTHCPGSHTAGRPCLATATTKARSWLLVEHPGPWAERIGEMDLPGPITGVLAEADRLGVRPQLIRRTGRRRSTPPLQVFAAWSGSSPWLVGRELADPAELTELDLASVAAGRRPGFGSESADRLLLVCAHGRRNACCARTGVPLARALTDRFGDAVWQTTHVGGDRYAANLLCLPHGLSYGNLDIAEGLAAAAGYGRGEIRLDHFRGRAGLTEPAQAAEHFLRRATGAVGIDEVIVESVRANPVNSTVSEAIVHLEAAATRGTDRSRYRVGVRRMPQDPCGPGCAESLGTYVLTDLTLLNGAALV